MVYHSAVAAHQTCAILCLSLLKELAEKLGDISRGRKGGEGGGVMVYCNGQGLFSYLYIAGFYIAKAA